MQPFRKTSFFAELRYQLCKRIAAMIMGSAHRLLRLTTTVFWLGLIDNAQCRRFIRACVAMHGCGYALFKMEFGRHRRPH